MLASIGLVLVHRQGTGQLWPKFISREFAIPGFAFTNTQKLIKFLWIDKICISHSRVLDSHQKAKIFQSCMNKSSSRFLRFNTLRSRQNDRRFADDTFKRIFSNENVRISIKISLKFVPKGPIKNNPALVQIMAWHRSGDKPLSEPMMVSLVTHICVTRPQWVKSLQASSKNAPRFSV